MSLNQSAPDFSLPDFTDKRSIFSSCGAWEQIQKNDPAIKQNERQLRRWHNEKIERMIRL